MKNIIISCLFVANIASANTNIPLNEELLTCKLHQGTTKIGCALPTDSIYTNPVNTKFNKDLHISYTWKCKNEGFLNWGFTLTNTPRNYQRPWKTENGDTIVMREVEPGESVIFRGFPMTPTEEANKNGESFFKSAFSSDCSFKVHNVEAKPSKSSVKQWGIEANHFVNQLEFVSMSAKDFSSLHGMLESIESGLESYKGTVFESLYPFIYQAYVERTGDNELDELDFDYEKYTNELFFMRNYQFGKSTFKAIKAVKCHLVKPDCEKFPSWYKDLSKINFELYEEISYKLRNYVALNNIILRQKTASIVNLFDRQTQVDSDRLSLHWKAEKFLEEKSQFFQAGSEEPESFKRLREILK